MLREAADHEHMKLVSEVMDVSQIDLVGRYADIYQVGARNMQNFTLLRELGRTRKPVLLKRGIAATIEEWLLSAEYILAGGNTDVILCERGIRTFESYTRNTLDISAIPVIKKLSHLPIITDPSHATGKRDKVAPMARASVAAGADGIIVEVHCNPDKALSDGAQSMFPAQFDRVMAELRIIAPAIGRSICVEPVAKRGWGAVGRSMADEGREAAAGHPAGEEPRAAAGIPARRGRGAWPDRRIDRAGGPARSGRRARHWRRSQGCPRARDGAARHRCCAQTIRSCWPKRIWSILAAPIQQNLELLRELPDNVTGAAVVTDTGSTKREIVEAAKSLPDRFTFIGGHPLGGAARGGIEHARPDLFAGRPWLFTPTSDRAAAALEQLQAFATGLGAVPRTLLSPPNTITCWRSSATSRSSPSAR